MSKLLKAFADRVASVPRLFLGTSDDQTNTPLPPGDKIRAASDANIVRIQTPPDRSGTPAAGRGGSPPAFVSSTSTPSPTSKEPPLTPARTALKQRMELLWDHYLIEQDETLRNGQFS